MIVVKITDGLGNQLFQYAHARWLQTKAKQKIYLDVSDINRTAERIPDNEKTAGLRVRREYQLNNLSITLPVIDRKRLSKIYKIQNTDNKFRNYCKTLRLLPTVYVNEAICNEDGFRFSRWQNYYVEGWYFDKKYYEEAPELLRHELRLKGKIIIPEEIQEILRNKSTVSLHVRRGDFLKIGRNISEGNYYIKALDYMKGRVKDPFFLVFSDEIEWVKENMDLGSEHLIISGQGFSDCEELMLMSMCRNHIIANSTFSYWGAWLDPNEEKIVISPRGWRQKVIPDTWVQL